MVKVTGSGVFVCVLLAGACSGKDPYAPGASVGVFHVAGRLVSSTCGATPNPWEFDVRLRHDASTLYWVQGGAPIQGHVDPQAHAVLTTRDLHTVREADAKTKTPACVVSRTDTLDVVLTAGGAAPADLATTDAFKGSLAYRFAPEGDADCGDQVGSTFASLPCDVVYEIAGNKTRPETR
jgi:hypothetical protein